MTKNDIYQISGTNYKEMTEKLLSAVNLAEDIKASLMPSARLQDNPYAAWIGIKPNLVSPTPASFGATTHPEIVAGIIEYLQEQGFRNIAVCEGSWVGDKTEDAFEYCGYWDLADTYGITLIDTKKDDFYSVKFRDSWVNICSCVKKIDYLINVPVIKGHCQTKMTCALKNMKGLIPDKEKRRFHMQGLHKPIAVLNACIHQDLIITDHICGDPDFEDGGNPLVTNCIMAAKDPVLMDALACRILGHDPNDVEYIRLSEKYGTGSMDLNNLNLITLQNPDNPENMSSRIYSLPPETADAVHKSLKLNYATKDAGSCSACYSSLTSALFRLQEEGKLSFLTEEKKLNFCIGQGYQGKKDNSPGHIGIGRCCSGFLRNIPGCPPTEDDIYDYLSRI